MDSVIGVITMIRHELGLSGVLDSVARLVEEQESRLFVCLTLSGYIIYQHHQFHLNLQAWPFTSEVGDVFLQHLELEDAHVRSVLVVHSCLNNADKLWLAGLCKPVKVVLILVNLDRILAILF